MKRALRTKSVGRVARVPGVKSHFPPKSGKRSVIPSIQGLVMTVTMGYGTGEVAGMANGSGEASDCRVDASAGDERVACGAGRRCELASGFPVAASVPARYLGRSCREPRIAAAGGRGNEQ